MLHRKEDLGLYQNQLNYMTTAWTVGYVIGEIPSNVVLTRIRPSLWIPTMEVGSRLLFVKSDPEANLLGHLVCPYDVTLKM